MSTSIKITLTVQTPLSSPPTHQSISPCPIACYKGRATYSYLIAKLHSGYDISLEEVPK